MPCRATKAQYSVCSVDALIERMPMLIQKIRPIGASSATQPSPVRPTPPLSGSNARNTPPSGVNITAAAVMPLTSRPPAMYQ